MTLAQISPQINGLHPGLVRRLTHPLRQPGVVDFGQSYTILARNAQMRPGLPLSDALLARWGRATATGGATTAAEQYPIVYVQTPPAAPLAADNAMNAHPAVAALQPRAEKQATVPTPVVKPVMAAASAPATPESTPAVSVSAASAPATPARQVVPTPRQVAAASAARPPMQPTTSGAAPEQHAAPSVAHPVTASAAGNRTSPLPLAAASTAAPADAVDGAAAPAAAVEVIQRVPATKKALSPMPIARPAQAAEAADKRPTPPEIGATPPRPVLPLAVRPAQNEAPVVRPVVKAPLLTRPPAHSERTQTATTPVVRSQPAPVFAPDQQMAAKATSESAPSTSTPVVQPLANQNGSQPAALPLRTAPAPSPPATGAIQRTPSAAAPRGNAQTPGARPAIPRATPRRAVGVNTPIIQRTGDDEGSAGAAAEVNQLDIEAIVDRVQRQFMRRLEVERERRGGASWR